MPLYEVELTDGRRFEVEADGPPSEADLLGYVGEKDVLVNGRPGHESLSLPPQFQAPQYTQQMGTSLPLPALGASGPEVPGQVPPIFNPQAVAQSNQQADTQLHSSMIGLTPELVPTGQKITDATGLSKALTVPASAVGKLGVGIGQFLTSPQGMAESAVAATPAAPAVLLKWAYDMLSGAKESGENLLNLPRQMINDYVVNQMRGQLGQPSLPTADYAQQGAEDLVNLVALGLGGLHVGGKGLGGVKKGAEGLRNPPIEPEVLPPGPKPPQPMVPPSRQLPEPFIDVPEVSGQGLIGPGQRQIGFPSMAEALAKVDPRVLESKLANDAASLAQGKAIASEEGQGSGQAPRAPISEDALTAERPLNPGGAQADLPPELRAISEKNNAPDAWAEFRRQLEEQQKKSGSTKEQDKGKPIEDRGPQGGNLSSFGFLDPAFWKSQLGIAHQAKVDAVQLYNRIRNKMGETSVSWKMLDTPEFKAFMQGTRTPQEVEKWVEENGPRVEVRKFGEGEITPEAKELNDLTHNWYDKLTSDQKSVVDLLQRGDGLSAEGKTTAASLDKTKLNRYIELAHDPRSDVEGNVAHWSSIAPKPKKDMPGYVEIAVVKPYSYRTYDQWKAKNKLNDSSKESEYRALYQRQFDIGNHDNMADAQFPSSHSFPPNTLGFGRAYEETLPKDIPQFGLKKGDKGLHSIEIQRDLIDKNESTGKFFIPSHGQFGEFDTYGQAAAKLKEIEAMTGIEYERLVIKAQIEHAREQGQKFIAISDAETAMMTEGHDRAGQQWVNSNSHNAARAKELLAQAKEGRAKVEDLYIEDLKKVANGEAREIADPTHWKRNGFMTSSEITQEQGMRLHYDRTLQKIAEELTGSKGEKVSFGEHKMAMDERLESGVTKYVLRDKEGNIRAESTQRDEAENLARREGYTVEVVKGHEKQPRKDLIFRNPDGTPKTDVSALVYPLKDVREHLTYGGKDAPPKPETALVKAQPTSVEKSSLATESIGGRSLKNLINIYVGRVGETGWAPKLKEAMLLGKKRQEELYPDELESIYDQLSLAREKLQEKGLSNEEVFKEIRARLFALGARQGKNVVKASRQEMEAERERLLAIGNDVKAMPQRRTQAVQDARTIGELLKVHPQGMKIQPKGGEVGAINLGVIKDAALAAVGPVRSAGQLVRWYSEPLAERLGRMGGPVSKQVSKEAGQIVSHQKKYYGELTPVLDPAKRALGKPTPANTWMRRLHQYTDRAAVNNMFAQNEGTVPANPQAARETTLLNRANLAIGHLATRANPNFVPSNKLQRMLTSYGVDIVRRGGGAAWEEWTKGIAQANGVPLTQVEAFFRRWKAEMDEPTSDVAALNAINQDFVRVFPKTVTHIKPGIAWHEVVVADPFAYLEGAAQRTASAVAFREVYPPGTSALQNTRKAVMAELKTDTQGTEFDNLIRALQGHPTDTFVSTLTAPDTWTGGGARMLGQVVGTPIKSLMLTGNFATNIGEVLVGGPAIFLGYRNALPAIMRLPWGYQQLEFNGQVNRALQNYAYDPSSPLRSVTRAVSGGVRTISAQQVLNELQEAHAAMAATVVANRIRAGNYSRAEGEHYIAAMRAMGMTEVEARRALTGDAELLGQFERRAASALTSGHMSMAERSRAGTSRAFNELFWFHSYPQMTLNQVRKVMENLAEDVKNRNTRQIRANSRLLARLLAGRTLQGAITAGIYALIFGGVFGLATKKKEAQDEFGKFLLDSYIGGLGGPAAIGKRMLEQGGDSKTLAANVAGISTPVSLAGEFLDMRMGNGKYEGRDWFEKIGMFVEGKTPAWRMFKTGLALHGLAEGNPKLDAAKKAFYRWKRELPGRQTTSSSGEPTEEDAAFTAQIRRVIDKLEKGGDWRTELKQVAEKDKSKSLFAKTILRDNNGAGLSEEQIGQLEQRIGKEAVSLLKARDAMVRQLARELGEKEGDVSAVSQPTGTLAVDTMSQGKRIERLENALPTDIREWLTKNELRLTDVSPERKEGPDRVLVKNEDYLKLEAEVVKEYEEGIRQLMDNPSFASASRKEKQERLNRRLSLAERRAKNLTR